MDSGAQRGFTLYELLIGVLIAGIVLGIGVPSLVDFSRNSRIVATANEFVSAVHLARGEAVTRKQGLTLCLSANPVAAVPVCTTDGSVTAGGYFVWVDSDADAVADNDEQILQQRAVPADVSFHSDSGFVHFGTRGYLDDIASAGNSATLVLFCDPRGNTVAAGGLSAARAVRLTPTGRPTALITVTEIDELSIDCP